jgi:hypothetical protein
MTGLVSRCCARLRIVSLQATHAAQSEGMKVQSTPRAAPLTPGETAPLLTPGASSSHGATAAPAVELPLRTSSSGLMQGIDSMLSGVPKRATVEAIGTTGIAVDLRGGPAFRGQVISALQKLRTAPTGQAVLNQVASIHQMYPEKRVVITPATGPTATLGTWHHPKSAAPGQNFLDTVVAKPTQDAFMPFVAGPGVDTAVVLFNPKNGRDYANDPHHGQPAPQLSHVELGHELIHASRYLHGAAYAIPMGDSTADRNTPAAEEELRTTGVGPWRNEPISENALRRDLGLPERQSYVGNRGTRLREPLEKNSPQTDARLAALGAKLKQD